MVTLNKVHETFTTDLLTVIIDNVRCVKNALRTLWNVTRTTLGGHRSLHRIHDTQWILVEIWGSRRFFLKGKYSTLVQVTNLHGFCNEHLMLALLLRLAIIDRVACCLILIILFLFDLSNRV